MKKDRGSTTIRDIAELAAVSCSTVSRALKGNTSISAATRRRVLRIARQLHYLPNQAAQMLIDRRHGVHGDAALISIIYEAGISLNDNYFSMLIKSIVDESSQDGFATAVYALVTTYDGVLSLSRLLKSRFTAGFILIGNIDDSLISLLATNCPNIVVVDKPSPYFTCVTNDNEGGAYAAVSSLIASGVRRVGLIHGTANHYFTLAMQAGYRRALADAGIPYDETLCVGGEFHIASGYTAMEALIARGRRPDGVFSNDEMAVGAMKALRDAGLSVPDDVAVFGFDDIVLSQIVEPGLSTVRVEYDVVARTAVRKLIENIGSDRFVPANVTIPVELIIRESTPRHQPQHRAGIASGRGAS
jgi:LacI family transcriptional regulator